ncbi:MAG: hypothetical protein AMJ73_05855 [candidate division Zixibacteria bacterium SM1_73]|nr:MAG: hypothetical protein AMJ73_05855 [candidate division Zixibacteria bacterium SM1_73]
MKKKASKKQNVLSDDAKNRCIWMTAGVISFKLCPFDYDCEHCHFDEAMRSQVRLKRISSSFKRHKQKTPVPKDSLSVPDDDSEKPFFFTFSVGEIDQGLYLHPTHAWVRRADDKKWKLGIDKLLAYVLPPPVKVDLDDLDKDLTKNQAFGKIHTEAGTIFLIVPLSGRLIQKNSRIVQYPELVQRDPYGEGWLATMDRLEDHSELEELYTGTEGEKFLEEEAQHLKFLLKHRGIEVDNLGATLPDGGANIKYLHQILPGRVCLRLAGELTMTGRQGW